MFYSQFILAKKGPLGTIWIAAHLERKLRKNQVADTDIGVSVDSILSPDVPIALRLSSHLLLGVVRIYSRKVNYLFNDCSEALLKIKQAFRSTVVDLPPEESTAPYHSITLPETFDLDDFELPDSDFQGNYTDHHISTREQITLQDSVEGPSYTTLQFGLDERFGDGDSSQMRLVLDEDLFMGNVPSPRYVQLGTEDGTGHEGQSSNAHTNMDIDKGNNGSGELINSHIPNLSEVLSNDCDKPVLSSVEKLRMDGDSSELHGYNIPTPDLNQSFPPDYHAFTTENIPSSSLFDHAQAPATPGLLEEAIRADVQEIPGLSPQEKAVSSSAMEVINTDNSALQLELEVSPAVNNIDCVNDRTMVHVSEHNSHSLSPLNSLLSEAKPVSLAPECSGGFSVSHEAHLQCGENTDDHLQGEFVHKTKPGNPSSKCLDGLLVASNVTHMECEQKGIDQIPSGFVFNDGSNLPLMHDGVEAIHSEVTHLDYPVTSSHSFQASKLDTSNKSVADEVVVVSSHDNVWVPGVTPETNSASLQNSAVPSIPSNEQTGDINSCVTRKTTGLSSDLYLRPCNSPMNLVNIVPSEAVSINKVDASILGNQSHVNNGDSCLIANAPAFSSGLHLQPCSLPLNQVNILSAEAGSLVENTSANSHSVRTFISDSPLVKQLPHVNVALVENAPAYPHSLPTYISDTPLVQPLHVDSSLVENAPASSCNVPTYISDTPLVKQPPPHVSLVENIPALQNVPAYISNTPMVKQPLHVNASSVQNTPALSHNVSTDISDTPMVKQPLHVNASSVQNTPALSHNVSTYISDIQMVKQPLHVNASSVQNTPALSHNVTDISDTPMVKQPLHVNASSVQNTPLSHNVSTYISDTQMVKQPPHVNASSVQNTPALSHNTCISDTPLVKQPPHVNVSLVENTPAHLHNGPAYISDTPLVKQPPHVNASFFNLPGEGNLAVNATNSFQETHQRSNSLLSSFLSDGSKQGNQSISVFPEKTQRVDPNSLSSTGYPEPEKILLASTLDFNLPNGSGRVIAEKGVSQLPKNIGPISNLSGNKDYSMDSSMILNNSKTYDQMTSLFSKESQLGNSNCFSSSICPEPEKMPLASSLDVNFPNDSGRVIAEKGVSQSAKNISPFSNLSGNKDYSINSSKILNNSRTHDQMTSLFSKESQLGNSNCFSSSRCPEPEKVLFASSCDVNQLNYQGQITAVKGVSESAESINQSSSLSGKKRPLTDNSTVLQNSNSLRRSSLPRAKKSTPYMPDDDDLLASILVGRAPTLRMGPTPPLPKAASRKRPRLTPRVGVPKRKVLIDDTMVLHADAIRKQLVNIEDIRRLRKKAPCTRPEIWMIQKNLMEEELFSESLLTGISTELNDLYARRYDMNDNRNSPIVDHRLSEFDLYVESSKEERPRMESVSRSSERETGDRTTAMPDRLDYGVLGSSGAPVSIPTYSGKEAVEPHVQDKLGHHVSQLEPSSNNQTITVSTGIVHERAGVESPLIRAPYSGNELEVSTVSRIEKEFVPKKIEVIAVVQEQELLRDSFQHFDRPREMADRMVNFVGTAVNVVTSAADEAGCRIIDTKMQEPPGTFVSVEVPKSTEAARFVVASAGDAARCRIIDTEMQEPPGTSISVEVPKCAETPGLEAQEKFEHHVSQLGPSSNSQTIAVSAGNVREAMVDLSLISSLCSGPELAISTVSTCEEEAKNTLHEPSSNNRIIAVSTGNVCGTVVVQPFVSSQSSGPELAISTVATCEEEAKNTLHELSSNNQTIAVSTGNVCETVVVQPLISSLSGPELEISTVSTREEEAKNTPHELSSNNQTIHETVVVQSSNSQTIAVSTGNVRETVVVHPLVSSPCFGPEIAISTVSTCEEEIKNTLHEASSNNQTIAVSTGNTRETVADLPLISGHELAISTVSIREEAKNTLHEPELIHDLPRPSEKLIEMFDRPSKFDGTAVDNVPSTEYLDTGNFVRTGEASITDDASFSQKNGRMDSVDLSGPQYGHIVGEIENGEILVSMLDKCLSEDGAGLPADSPNVNKHANDPIPETAGKIDQPTEVATISGFHVMEEIENELAVAVRGEHVTMKMDEPTSEVFRSENPQAVNPFLHQHNTETENVLSAVGDNSGLLECIVEGSLDGESAPMDTGAARELGQLNNGVEVNLEVNDTEFLNADYEADIGAAADNNIPDSEASLENSGWSTRTRGVARFLKTLFDAEHGRGKKIIPVDHLLAGKTRKEASRMFFETLVLKTRDYIHVEQEVPFESIKIKPRPKLLKSEF